MELQCCFGNLGLDSSSKGVPSTTHDGKARVTKSGNVHHMFHISELLTRIPTGRKCTVFLNRKTTGSKMEVDSFN